MTTTCKTLSLVAAFTLALGCGGGDDASEGPSGHDETAGGEHGHGHGHGHGGEHHPEHEHQMSEAQTAFHDQFAPLWHSEAGPERAALACEQLDGLEPLASSAAASTTEGVDAPEASDTQLTADMQAAFDALRAEGCSGDAPVVEAVDRHLSTIHDVFHRSMERWQALR